MRSPTSGSSLWSVCLLMLAAAPAHAQGSPPVGIRAAGMGGAFTAVADDAAATVWNPAGLASGSYFSAAIDGNRFDGQSSLFVGIGTPPLGLTYYRTATAGLANGRNTLVAHTFGASLVQSIGQTGIAVGTTLKVVHGVVSTGDASMGSTAFDADAGVMVSGALGQIGLTVRNLARPSFALPDASGSIRLDRMVRGGVALHVWQDTTVAADADFTKALAVAGAPWRDLAVGIETRAGQKAWVRGGMHVNTAGGGTGSGAAPIATAGASYAIRGALTLDAQGSVGSSKGNRGWGVGLRFAY
jgi:hypothetical protein